MYFSALFSLLIIGAIAQFRMRQYHPAHGGTERHHSAHYRGDGKSPHDTSTNFKGNKIVFNFNEYVGMGRISGQN